MQNLTVGPSGLREEVTLFDRLESRLRDIVKTFNETQPQGKALGEPFYFICDEKYPCQVGNIGEWSVVKAIKVPSGQIEMPEGVDEDHWGRPVGGNDLEGVGYYIAPRDRGIGSFTVAVDEKDRALVYHDEGVIQDDCPALFSLILDSMTRDRLVPSLHFLTDAFNGLESQLEQLGMPPRNYEALTGMKVR